MWKVLAFVAALLLPSFAMAQNREDYEVCYRKRGYDDVCVDSGLSRRGARRKAREHQENYEKYRDPDTFQGDRDRGRFVPKRRQD